MRSHSTTRAAAVALALSAMASATLAADATWTRIIDAPTDRTYATAAYDATRDRVVLYTTDVQSPYLRVESYVAEVWQCDLARDGRWTPWDLIGDRWEGRQGAPVLIDAAADRLLVGAGAHYWSLADTLLAASLGSPHIIAAVETHGAGPPAYTEYSATALDAATHQWFVFGGAECDAAACPHFWVFDLLTRAWREVPIAAGAAPPSTHGASMVVDTRRQRLLVFGDSLGDVPTTQVWSCGVTDSARWTPLAVVGALPPGRTRAAALYDSVADRVVVIGGIGRQADGRLAPLADAWSLRLGDTPMWRPLALPAALGPRSEISLIWRMPGREALLVGGRTFAATHTDVWSFDTRHDAWTQLVADSQRPQPWGDNAVRDPAGDRLLSWDTQGVYAAPLAAPSQWRRIGTPSAAPWYLDQAAAIDPVAGRLVVFGGAYDQASTADVVSLTATLQLRDDFRVASFDPGATGPSERASSSFALDTRRHRLLTFAGYGPQSPNDLWALALDDSLRWERLAPTPSPWPPRRAGHRLLYDPVRDRLLVVCGAAGDTPLGDVWELPLGDALRWRELTPSGAAPPPRSECGAAYDARRDRLVLYGGRSGYDMLDDVWALNLAPTPRWERLLTAGTTPAGRSDATFVYDPLRDRFVLHDGFVGDHGRTRDDWILQPTDAYSPRAGTMELAVTPSPVSAAARRIAVRVFAPARGRIDATLADVRGRVIVTTSAFAEDAGWVRLELAPTARLARGVYLVSARGVGVIASGRCVVADR